MTGTTGNPVNLAGLCLLAAWLGGLALLDGGLSRLNRYVAAAGAVSGPDRHRARGQPGFLHRVGGRVRGAGRSGAGEEAVEGGAGARRWCWCCSSPGPSRTRAARSGSAGRWAARPRWAHRDRARPTPARPSRTSSGWSSGGWLFRPPVSGRCSDTDRVRSPPRSVCSCRLRASRRYPTWWSATLMTSLSCSRPPRAFPACFLGWACSARPWPCLACARCAGCAGREERRETGSLRPPPRRPTPWRCWPSCW